MTLTSQPERCRPAGRGLAMLVLAVLAGVLGMHGLAPGSVPAGHTHARHEPAHTIGVSLPGQDGDCPGPSGGCHVTHADAACSAAGIAAGYVPPPLAEATCPHLPVAEAPVSFLPQAAGSGRAPPDLAELQLLRI